MERSIKNKSAGNSSRGMSENFATPKNPVKKGHKPKEDSASDFADYVAVL